LCLTINSVPQKHSGLMNETFWTRQLCEWRRHENRWQIDVFAVKRV